MVGEEKREEDGEEKAETRASRAAMAALYLRGAPRRSIVSRREAEGIARTLRVTCPELERVSAVLADGGFWAAAWALEEPGLLAWGEKMVEEGRCATTLDDGYPSRWGQAFRGTAPPAVWVSGRGASEAFGRAKCLGVVGCRAPSLVGREFARGAGSAAAAAGVTLVSGGAAGCDRAAAKGAVEAGGAVMEIFPCGLDRATPLDGALGVSVCPPKEPFSPGAAMERNRLIYGAGDRCLAAEVRDREGGAWAGAVDAIRLRITEVLVRAATERPGHRALAALGATAVREPADCLAEGY